MRWHNTALALAVVVCSGVGSHAEEPTADSAENFIKAWIAAFNDDDPQETVAFYDQSKETDVVLATGVRYRGYEAIRKMYREAQNEVRFLDSSAKQTQTRILGDTALVTFEHMFKLQIRADGTRWQGHVRTTSVLHRVGQDWRILHEHSSTIRGIERLTRIED